MECLALTCELFNFGYVNIMSAVTIELSLRYNYCTYLT